MNQNGKEYLSSIKHDLQVPLISKITEGIHPYLDHELLVSKVYGLVTDQNTFKEEFKPLINMYIG